MDTLKLTNPVLFLSTLSLRRATMYAFIFAGSVLFLSTLSLRRATPPCLQVRRTCTISIHALLAESDHIIHFLSPSFSISIHALLAESDSLIFNLPLCRMISIHALLAESDLSHTFRLCFTSYFYPRSPCGERPRDVFNAVAVPIISIHALLAESDNRFSAVK